MSQEIIVIIKQLDDFKKELNNDYQDVKYLDEKEDKVKEYKLKLDQLNESIGDSMEERELVRDYRKYYRLQIKNIRLSKIENKSFAKRELLKGATETEMTETKSSAEEVIDHGKKTMTETKESLEKMQGIIKETVDIGKNTAIKIDQNNKQIVKISENTVEIQSTLSRAGATVKRIARKIATDKVIWLLIFLIVCAIVLAVLANKKIIKI